MWQRLRASKWPPTLPTLEATQPRPLIIYDAHNAEWILQKRAFMADLKNPARWPAAAYSWVQWHRLRRYEARFAASGRSHRGHVSPR